MFKENGALDTNSEKSDVKSKGKLMICLSCGVQVELSSPKFGAEKCLSCGSILVDAA